MVLGLTARALLQPAATSDARSITCASSENGTEGQRPKPEDFTGTDYTYPVQSALDCATWRTPMRCAHGTIAGW